MTDGRKKDLKSLIVGLFGFSILTLIVFFMFFALPPVALAAPAAIWTFYGFLVLHFITQKPISEKWQMKAAALNFAFVLTAEFAFPFLIDTGDAKILRIAGIVLFSATCVAEIVFWVRLIKAHFFIKKEL